MHNACLTFFFILTCICHYMSILCVYIYIYIYIYVEISYFKTKHPTQNIRCQCSVSWEPEHPRVPPWTQGLMVGWNHLRPAIVFHTNSRPRIFNGLTIHLFPDIPIWVFIICSHAIHIQRPRRYSHIFPLKFPYYPLVIKGGNGKSPAANRAKRPHEDPTGLRDRSGTAWFGVWKWEEAILMDIDMGSISIAIHMCIYIY